MIDCGEGAQLSLRKYHVGFSRLVHIFISHLHGDHCFGLPGLISSLGLLGRTAPLFIHGPKGIDTFLKPILDFFCSSLPYEVKLCIHGTSSETEILQTRSLSVSIIPLSHRIPCTGFLFKEQKLERHLIKEMLDFYQIPLALRKGIANGEDYHAPDGSIIPNERLVRRSTPPVSYAFCSDTKYAPDIIPIIEGCTLLYHEATFLESEKRRAQETYHSTAKDAAQIASLAKVNQLLIGHYSARYPDEKGHLKEATAIFPNTIAATEGLTIDF